MLIIKDKIGNQIPGTPTISDKYDVMTGIVEKKDVFEGQLIDLDVLFKDGLVKAVTNSSKRAGVVMHQNVKTELGNVSLQIFKPGEVVGVCVKGYVTALAHKDHDFSLLKMEDEIIKHSGSIDLATITNIIQTGKFDLNKKLDKKVIEVEVK